MKWTLTIALSLFALTILPQDKFYTKGLANGYAWTAPLSVSPPVYAKDESLLASLIQRRYLSNIDSSLNIKSFPLDCEGDVNNLAELNKSTSLEIDVIVKMIDEFYNKEENLIIPVLGAYCYCVKELAGTDKRDLENYKKDVLNFSKEESEQ